jgi:hypothetical protein
MQLDYSYNGIAPLLHPGPLPFPDKHPRKVKVSIGTSSNVFEGDLVFHLRVSTNEFGVTLFLDCPMGVTPPYSESSPSRWVPKPNSAIRGLMRVALTLEAISKIRKVSDDAYDYELTLIDPHFTDKTETL